MTGHAPKHQKFVKSPSDDKSFQVWLIILLSKSKSFVTRGGERAAWKLGVHRPASNSFGKKAVKTKHALPHCTPAPPARTRLTFLSCSRTPSLCPILSDSTETQNLQVAKTKFTSVNGFIGSALVEKSYAPLDNKETESRERKSQFESRRGIERFIKKLEQKNALRIDSRGWPSHFQAGPKTRRFFGIP